MCRSCDIAIDLGYDKSNREVEASNAYLFYFFKKLVDKKILMRALLHIRLW